MDYDLIVISLWQRRVRNTVPTYVILARDAPNVASLDLVAFIMLAASLTCHGAIILTRKPILYSHCVILWTLVAVLAKSKMATSLVTA